MKTLRRFWGQACVYASDQVLPLDITVTDLRLPFDESEAIMPQTRGIKKKK